VLQGEIGRAKPGRFQLCSATVLASLRRELTADQGEEGPQSGSVDGGGVELDSGGKHSRCMEAFKAFHLALSASSCAISISVCFVRCSISLVCRSISLTGRQLSVDKNCRHRGSDEQDSPLLLEREVAAGDVDVVIGGEQGDQAEEQAADGLDEAEPIEAGPGTLGIDRFWRSRRLLADRILGIGHGLGSCSKGVGANRTGIAHPFSSATIAAVCLSRSSVQPLAPQGQHRPQPRRLSCCTNRCTRGAMVIGVRMEPELERRLDLLAHQLGKSRSACIREAISQYLLRHGDDEEARRQSQLLAELEAPNWSERVPDWSDWTA
jgi:predicted transcriptional regulator